MRINQEFVYFPYLKIHHKLFLLYSFQNLFNSESLIYFQAHMNKCFLITNHL